MQTQAFEVRLPFGVAEAYPVPRHLEDPVYEGLELPR